MYKMKGILLQLFILFSFVTAAQQPQEILGIAKESKSTQFYKEQLKLWKSEIAKNPKDPNSWYQRYKAERAYIQKSEPDSWLNRKGEVFAQLQKAIDESKKHIGGSYEYYIMQSINCIGEKANQFSQKAFEIDPERVETYEGLLIHYVVTFQEEKAEIIAKKMLEKNYYSNAILKWNYNALQTAAQKGIVITDGDMDAIPKWVLQFGQGTRRDVLVLNKWLLTDLEDYRKLVLKKIDVSDISKTKMDNDDPSFYMNRMTVHLLKNSKRPIYLGCGTPKAFFKQFGLENDMYLIGMFFQYSIKGMDNLAITIRNFENNYDLEYLFNNFQTHSDDVMTKQYLNLAYLPGLVKLENHFKLVGDIQKAGYYNKLIIKIAEDSGRKDEILAWFK